MEALNLVMVKCEAWVLSSTSKLVGAQRLIILGDTLHEACCKALPQAKLRRILLSIKDEARLVLCFLGQDRPRQLLPDNSQDAAKANTAVITMAASSSVPAPVPAPMSSRPL